jgi:hypothetical protein
MRTFIIAILFWAVTSLSSCWVGVEGRHHRHSGQIIIQTGDTGNPRDSLNPSAQNNAAQKDSLASPAGSGNKK